MSAIATIMPMVAPAVGAFMIARLGWRSVHIALTVAGLVLTVFVASVFRETKPMAPRPAGRVARTLGLAASGAMLREAWFGRLLATNACSYGAIFCYIAGTPVVLMGRLGYSNGVYSALFACTAFSLACGAWSSAWLGRVAQGRLSRLIGSGLAVQAACYVVLLLTDSASVAAQVAVIVPALLLSCFVRGVVAPNMAYLAVSAHRENAGLASALLGFTQLLTGALTGAIVAGLLPRFGYQAVAGTMAAFACLSLAIWLLTAPTGQPAD